MSAGVVIAGAGQGGFQLATSLRSAGYDGLITLIGDEPGLPYQRPPLSKGFLSGKEDIEESELRPQAFFQQQRIEVIAGERITRIDSAGQRVVLSSSTPIPYQHLVLATGARNRLLEMPGAELEGVCYLRTRVEAIELRERMMAAQNIVIIGGGFIGLEVAAMAGALGRQVVVLEFRERLMSRVVAPAISEYFRLLHEERGIQFVFGAITQAITGVGNKVTSVVLSDGTSYPADLVIGGVGVVPNSELAEAAGFEVGNGIVVDDHLRTANPSVFALGDCAYYPNRFAGGAVRLESVQNAVDQASCVAAHIAGRPQKYEAVPWFWTDQYHIKLQMAGLSHGYDLAVTRGDPASHKFSVLYFKQNQLIAIDSIHRPGEHMAGRKLIAGGTSLRPEQGADLSVELKTFVAAI